MVFYNVLYGFLWNKPALICFFLVLISGYPAPGWTQLGLCHHQLYSRAAQWAATVVEMELDGWIDWIDMGVF